MDGDISIVLLFKNVEIAHSRVMCRVLGIAVQELVYGIAKSVAGIVLDQVALHVIVAILVRKDVRMSVVATRAKTRVIRVARTTVVVTVQVAHLMIHVMTIIGMNQPGLSFLYQ